MLPRSLSAAAQRCASKPRLAPLLFACFAIQSPPVSCNFEGSALPAGYSYSSTGFAEMTGRPCLSCDRMGGARRARGCIRAVCRQVRHRDLRTPPPPTFRPAALRRRHRLRDQRRIDRRMRQFESFASLSTCRTGTPQHCKHVCRGAYFQRTQPPWSKASFVHRLVRFGSGRPCPHCQDALN